MSDMSGISGIGDTSETVWDLAIVGSGPAGSSAALGALAAQPDLKVLVLDRYDFPRDKACGDGIAPHVIDVLAGVGVHGLLDDWTPVQCLQLRHGAAVVSRQMPRPVWVVPRTVFDAKLARAAVQAGASLARHRVRDVRLEPGGVVIDDRIRARVVVGADGAHSLLRPVSGLPPVRRRALALRGYAATPPGRRGTQAMAFGRHRQPSYAWSFDRGDGLANVGYGELLEPDRPPPSRGAMLDQLEQLLPGATAGGTSWRGHHLPLSSWSWQQPDGRILLAGDAAGLINPMTGEGIYYAVATGVLAGRAAVSALASGRDAGSRYREAVRSLLARHLRHTTIASRLVSVPAIAVAGVRAAARDQGVFDDLVEVGLGRGRLTARAVRGLCAAAATGPAR